MDNRSPEPAETRSLRERYARRVAADSRYSLLNPSALWAMQERQRAILALYRRLGWTDLAQKSLLEIGCGTGSNLVEAVLMGFAPANLGGIELLEDRAAVARERLPEEVGLQCGDATVLVGEFKPVDVVMQMTVFSSLLDAAFQQRLANAMWSAAKRGGGVLWYDFTYDNPSNPDVRGVPLARVRELFPHGRVQARRLTLAPPLARAVTRLHPSLYTFFNTLPALRTHLLCWIAKD